MSRLPKPTKDCLFFSPKYSKGQRKGQFNKNGMHIFSKSITTHVIQYKICHIHIIASWLLLC